MTNARRDEGRHLSVHDLIERFGVSRQTLHRWQKDETLQFPKPFKINKRNYFRLSEIEAFEAACGAEDDVERALGLPIVSPVITKYDDFCGAMARRRRDLKISTLELDQIAGLGDGHITKLENYANPSSTNASVRGMGPETFPLWLGGLRVGIILVDLPRRPHKPRKRISPVEEARA